MSTAFQEKRVRRTDIWFAVIFLSAFAVLLAIEITIQLNTRDETFKYLQQMVMSIEAQRFAPSDPNLMPMLETQAKEMESLMLLSEQKARVAFSMKKRLDSHAERISKMQKVMDKLLKAEQAEREKVPPKEKEAPRPKLGPRK